MRLLAIACAVVAIGGCEISPTDGTLYFHVIGRITEASTNAPVAGLVVGVVENANLSDRYHASTVSGIDGNFTLDFSSSRCVKWYLVTERSEPMRISCELGVRGVVMNIVIPSGR